MEHLFGAPKLACPAIYLNAMARTFWLTSHLTSYPLENRSITFGSVPPGSSSTVLSSRHSTDCSMLENQQTIIRFGPFEADLQAVELRKHGVRLRLPAQSFQILRMLLERPGKLVTREELQKALWPADTFVDFDHSVNAAVNRLRDALGDSANDPCLIETLPRRGYRFIGEVKSPEPAPSGTESPSVDAPAHPESGQPAAQQQAAVAAVAAARPWYRIALWSLFAGLMVVAAVYAYLRARSRVETISFTTVPFTSLRGLEVAPSFSPDGRRVVFAWFPNFADFSISDANNDGYDLYVKAAGSEKLVRLTNHPSLWISPAWSPDGKQIAFHRLSKADNGLYVVSAEGGAERKLLTTHVTLPGSSRISWSPDGKSIAFDDSPPEGGHRRLHLLRMDTQEAAQIEHDERCQEESIPAFSPDGKYLAYLCFLDASNNYAIAVASSSGRAPRFLRTFPGWPWGIVWTADSKRLILSQFQMGDHLNSLFEIALSNGSLRRIFLSTVGDLEWPAMSPQGDKIAFDDLATSPPEIWRHDLQHPERPDEKLITSSRSQRQPSYSPDGKHIVFASDRGGSNDIWIADADGTNPTQLTNLKNAGSPSWAPDGKKIVFDCRVDGHAGVYVIDISERVPHKLATNLPEASVPSWSHDGKWIYFIGGPSAWEKIYRAPSTGGDATLLSSSRGYGPSESPNGDAVYFTAGMTNDNLRITRASLNPTGTEGPVQGLPPVFPLAWTVTRDGIYFSPADDIQHIQFFGFATGKIRSVFTPRPVPHTFSVSPDGRYFVYAVGALKSDIVLLDNFH